MLQLFFRTVEVDRRNIDFTLVPTLFPWLCNILAETGRRGKLPQGDHKIGHGRRVW